MTANPTPTPKILAVDATNRAHVLHHANPNKVGQRFGDEMQWLADRLKPCRVVCCFDAAPSLWRRELVPGYKAGRKHDDAVTKAIAECVEQVTARKYIVLAADGWEADDLIASIAAAAVRYDERCVIVSPDKDMRQCLVAGRVSILRRYSRSNGGELDWITADSHLKEYDFPPFRWPDYQAIVGDSTDGVKGWEGAGPKAAGVWLRKWSLAEIVANPAWIHQTTRQQATFADFAARAAAVRECVTLRTNAPLVEEIF